MKSAMPFLGVSSPVLRRVWREASTAHPPGDEWRTDVLRLWCEAEYREERYAALMLLRRRERDADLPLVEELVVTAWWDLVDSLAHVVGALLRGDASVAEAVRGWSRDENLWKRRVSIICQLGFKGDTDLGLLYDCIEPN